MTIPVEIWIRGTDFATTREISSIEREPGAWVEDDVRAILEGMLLLMDEAKNPGQGSRVASLRGFSWIVNPFEGGVLIALEMTLGAAVAGPFIIDKARLEAMITRVMAKADPVPPVVH